MKKWIVIAVLIIAGSVIAWRSGLLNLGLSTTDSEILSYVPADTMFYVGGESADKMAEFMNGYPLMPSSPSQSAIWKNLLKSDNKSDNKNETPRSKFFAHLLNEYQAFSNGTIGGFAKFTGISFSGAYAVFSDGLMPVLRIKVASADALDSQIENAVANSQWQYTWETVGDIKARVWQLTDESEEKQLYLALAHHDGSVVITFITNADSVDDKKRRFGIIKPEPSLANTVSKADSNLPQLDVSALKTRYGYTDDMLVLIQFDQLAHAVLSPSDNRLGQDLLKYLPKDQFEAYQAKISESCRTEYTQLVAQMPRLVMGYQGIDFQQDTMNYSIHSILELKNTGVVTELQKMQGHLPAHSKQSLGKIVSFGLGLNADGLPPALMALWTQFTEAPFTCEHLKTAQEKIRSTNPAMLGMGMAMAEGVKGLGLSVFDLSLDENTSMPSEVDFLASIAAENPIILMNMAKVVPFLKNIELPADGTAISIQLPMVPPGIDIKAAIKGKHIAVYSGEKSAAQANSLSSEAIVATGLYTAGFDYRKLAELSKSERLQNLASGTGTGAAICIQQHEMAHMLQFYKMDLDMMVATGADGLVTHYRGSMDKPKAPQALVPGEYTVEVLNQSCIWESIAVDTLRNDGTGLYVEKSFDGNCDLYQSAYTWQHTGGTLQMSDSEKSRDSCAEDFSAPEKHLATCHLMNMDKDSFQCLYDPATLNAELYRYTRI